MSSSVGTPTDPYPWFAAPEAESMAPRRERYGLFIDGEFVSAADGRTFKTFNPATGDLLAEVACAAERDVARAVAAARNAQEHIWGPMHPSVRSKYLFRIARILAERAREFAVLETLDGGKPISESRDVDVPLAAQHFFYYAGWADKLTYAGLGPNPAPLGVVGQIIPWNFPLLMAAWKIAPALACGNTVVLKPAETTPLTALLLAEVCAEAGLPAGVVNIVTGASDTGAAVVGGAVDKVAFTGSTGVGRGIAQALAGTGRRVTLELGGKSANLVFDDASISEAVDGIVDGIFFNQGHVCCAGSRLLVQESVAEEVIERLQGRMGSIRVGDPMDKNTDLGAINSAAQLARINELVSVGVTEGVQQWAPDCELPTQGLFYKPTLLLDVEPSHRVAREEIFGPVLCVMTFRTTEEAVELANDTPYGLAAGVWSSKGSRALWVAQRLRAGVVWANSYNLFDPASPFGGFRASGYGREGGKAGLEAYLENDSQMTQQVLLEDG